MGYINYCQQLRMGIRLFPCCLTALLTRKTESPHCPVGMGKNPLLDPFKGNSGICIKTSLFALKLRNGNDLQRFLNKTLPNVFFLSSAPFSLSKSPHLHQNPAFITLILHNRSLCARLCFRRFEYVQKNQSSNQRDTSPARCS